MVEGSFILTAADSWMAYPITLHHEKKSGAGVQLLEVSTRRAGQIDKGGT
jgi:hypothetical protein